MNIDKEKRNEQNYKSFGIAMLIILFIIIMLGVIGYYVSSTLGHLEHDPTHSSSYNAGRVTGRFIGSFIRNGFAYGGIIAIIASMEKRNNISLVLFHGVLGWVYVVYYALTRKTVLND